MAWDKAFDIVEIELGLMYDLFYTKAFVLYSPYGFLLRVLTFSSTVAAFAAFLLNIDKKGYPNTEVIITYILLVGAIFLEFYAIIILISSDMMAIWLGGDWLDLPKFIRNFKGLIVSISKVVPWLRKLHAVPSKKRWSNAIGQYNVLTHCLKRKPKCIRLHDFVEKHLIWTIASVPKGVKALIFDELRKRVRIDAKKLGSYRGDKILLEEINYYDKEDNKHELEFDQSVILWHMATDLCYHADVDGEEKVEKKWLSEFILEEGSAMEDNKLKFRREISKLLSNYMMHLLIKSPFMLPSGIGQIRFHDTCAEATEFLDNQKLSRKEACEMLDRVDTRYPPSQVKGDRSKSLLFDACKLANCLKLQGDAQKWEIITQAWLDILTFAAAQCRWNNHAEKLSQGGELLTHVWLLMAHFGMTDQFQISQGYVRAKLDLK